VLPNPVGTAPGFSMMLGNARFFFTPGVPREMEHIFAESIVPVIAPLAEELTKLGFEVVEHATVEDDADRIVTLVRRFAEAHRVVIVTGGLGPTSDDLTTAAAAKAAGVALRRDQAVVEDIRRKFEAFGRVMPESNAKQADFPEGASVLPNPVGTAPGFSMCCPTRSAPRPAFP